MKKQLINAKEAACLTCFVGRYAIINDQSKVVCEHCGSANLIDYTGEIFQPQYAPEKFYRASKYTPPLPCRRVNQRSWPKVKERRKEKVAQ